jgi:TrmH family RNA methyltransferase
LPAERPPLAATNPRIKQLRRLVGRRSARREAGAFIVDGPLLVREAVARGAPIECVYVDEADDPAGLAWLEGLPAPEIVPVRAGVLARVLDPVTPRAVAAVCTRRPTALDDLPSSGTVVVLADLADPGNVGTLVRSAAAFGATAVVVTPSTADPFAPKAVRASAGAVLDVLVVEADLVVAIASLAAQDRAIWVADAHGQRTIDDAPADRAVALVVGNESHGVPSDLGPAATTSVRIPMAGGPGSCNAAVAGSILLFEIARRQGNLDGHDPIGQA